MFFPRDDNLQNEYNKFESIIDLFQINISGFTTSRDHFAVAYDEATLKKRISLMRSIDLDDADLRSSFNITDTRDWKLPEARARLQSEEDPNFYMTRALYRPFDFRYCYLDDAVMDYPRPAFKDHVLGKENLLLCIGRQGLAVNDDTWSLVFCSNLPVDKNVYRRGGVSVLPLFTYGEANDLLANPVRAKSALNQKSLTACKLALGNQNDDLMQTSLSFFYFAYSLLFSNSYRLRYADFLKSDFPRIPMPQKSKVADRCVSLGRRLVNIHLMEDELLKEQMTNFIDSGYREIEKISYTDKTVWINKAKTCGFKGVPEAVWKFHIGGYQVCDKWLKDRKAKVGKDSQAGRVLSDTDIEHYQQIIVSISETIQIMAEIDETIEAHGGWPDAFITANS